MTTHPTEAKPLADQLQQLLQGLNPTLRGFALRLIREIDEPEIDTVQLQRLQSLLTHLDTKIAEKINFRSTGLNS